VRCGGPPSPRSKRLFSFIGLVDCCLVFRCVQLVFLWFICSEICLFVSFFLVVFVMLFLVCDFVVFCFVFPIFFSCLYCSDCSFVSFVYFLDLFNVF